MTEKTRSRQKANGWVPENGRTNILDRLGSKLPFTVDDSIFAQHFSGRYHPSARLVVYPAGKQSRSQKIIVGLRPQQQFGFLGDSLKVGPRLTSRPASSLVL